MSATFESPTREAAGDTVPVSARARRTPSLAQRVVRAARDSRPAYALSKLGQYRRARWPSLYPSTRDVLLPRLRTPSPPPADADVYLFVRESIGRYLYLLLRFLTARGATVAVLGRMPLADYLHPYGRMSLGMERVTFARALPARTEDKVLVADRPPPEVAAHRWRRVVNLDFDVSAPAARHTNCLVMPYPMHPLQYAARHHERLAALRGHPRSMKVLFAGTFRASTHASFRNAYLTERFHALLRPQIVAAVLAQPADDVLLVSDAAGLAELLAAEGGDAAADRCVVVDGARVHVPPAHWLGFVARSEFFLCAPGVSMPLCHNAIEAMAVGTIPILNYREWFRPWLEDGRTCVAFADEEELVERLREVRALPPARIAAMRRWVAEYYDAYLAPEPFAEAVVNGTAAEATLFVNAEQFHRLARVDRDSVILAGHSPADA